MSTQTPDVPELDSIPSLSGENGAGDRLSNIRAMRQDLSKKDHLTLLVPGYHGLVAVRYRTLPRTELDALIGKVQGAGTQSINDNMDLLIRCCNAVLVRQTPDDEWEPIDLGQSEPTTFSTGNLARCLGEEANSARDEVAALFSPGGAQPLAPEAHSDPLFEWQRDSDYKIDQALLGE